MVDSTWFTSTMQVLAFCDNYQFPKWNHVTFTSFTVLAIVHNDWNVPVTVTKVCHNSINIILLHKFFFNHWRFPEPVYFQLKNLHHGLQKVGSFWLPVSPCHSLLFAFPLLINSCCMQYILTEDTPQCKNNKSYSTSIMKGCPPYIFFA